MSDTTSAERVEFDRIKEITEAAGRRLKDHFQGTTTNVAFGNGAVSLTLPDLVIETSAAEAVLADVKNGKIDGLAQGSGLNDASQQRLKEATAELRKENPRAQITYQFSANEEAPNQVSAHLQVDGKQIRPTRTPNTEKATQLINERFKDAGVSAIATAEDKIIITVTDLDIDQKFRAGLAAAIRRVKPESPDADAMEADKTFIKSNTPLSGRDQLDSESTGKLNRVQNALDSMAAERLTRHLVKVDVSDAPDAPGKAVATISVDGWRLKDMDSYVAPTTEAQPAAAASRG